jgi:hypothetical protein
MLEHLAPTTRSTLIRARVVAILGDLPSACAIIEEALTPSGASGHVALVALWMLKAELLHLNCEDTSALEIFRDRIDPLLPFVPEDVAVVAGFNRSDVSFAAFSPDNFYSLVDHGRVARVDLWRHESLLDASSASSKGDLYKAVPAIWRELDRAYLQGCWRPYQLASVHMARECLELGLAGEATFNAIMSRNEETAKQVGHHVLRAGTSESAAAAVIRVLKYGHLRRLFATACQVLTPMLDAVPDESVASVFEWLLKGCRTVPTSIGERQTMSTAWETLRGFAFRLNDEQARQLVTAASTHPSWHTMPTRPNEVVPIRKTMLQAICNATRVMRPNTASDVAHEIVPLAGERKQDFDYPQTIETLCQMAARGGARLKARLRKALYPKGKPLNTVLMQAASAFDQVLKRRDLLAKDAYRIAESTRLQVQRVPLDHEPEPCPGTFLTVTKNRERDKLVVHMVVASETLAILQHRKELGSKPLNALLTAILDMVREPENVLANKFCLVDALGCVGDVISRQNARKVFDVLAPLSMGEITEPTCVMSAAEVANPMNPFKIDTGSPAQLRGISLVTLACIERDLPGRYGRQLLKLLEEGLSDPDPTVRSFALAAAREAPRLAASTLAGLLLATRDSDPEVASVAFEAIASCATDAEDEPLWKLFGQSLRFATRSVDVRVRRSAAFATSRLLRTLKGSGVERELASIRAIFLKDRCYSVRRNANAK